MAIAIAITISRDASGVSFVLASARIAACSVDLEPAHDDTASLQSRSLAAPVRPHRAIDSGATQTSELRSGAGISAQSGLPSARSVLLRQRGRHSGGLSPAAAHHEKRAAETPSGCGYEKNLRLRRELNACGRKFVRAHGVNADPLGRVESPASERQADRQNAAPEQRGTDSTKACATSDPRKASRNTSASM
eukprot:Amastigsp_a842246_59.p3 type:complete len:192 gc:universal Amastigsp_a842246_59:817-242(-)